MTIVVEDSLNSEEADLFQAARESAEDYSKIYLWRDIELVFAGQSPKNASGTVAHFFEIFGQGTPVAFDDESLSESRTSMDSKLVAKGLTP